MTPSDFTRNSQPQTTTLLTCAEDAIKALEYPFTLVFRDTWAVVFHRKFNVLRALLYRYCDMAIARCVAQGIIYQVVQQLAQQQSITLYLTIGLRRGKPQVYVFCQRLRYPLTGDFLCQLG